MRRKNAGGDDRQGAVERAAGAHVDQLGERRRLEVREAERVAVSDEHVDQEVHRDRPPLQLRVEEADGRSAREVLLVDGRGQPEVLEFQVRAVVRVGAEGEGRADGQVERDLDVHVDLDHLIEENAAPEEIELETAMESSTVLVGHPELLDQRVGRGHLC